jgi:hypothetical protein
VISESDQHHEQEDDDEPETKAWDDFEPGYSDAQADDAEQRENTEYADTDEHETAADRPGPEGLVDNVDLEAGLGHSSPAVAGHDADADDTSDESANVAHPTEYEQYVEDQDNDQNEAYTGEPASEPHDIGDSHLAGDEFYGEDDGEAGVDYAGVHTALYDDETESDPDVPTASAAQLEIGTSIYQWCLSRRLICLRKYRTPKFPGYCIALSSRRGTDRYDSCSAFLPSV